MEGGILTWLQWLTFEEGGMQLEYNVDSEDKARKAIKCYFRRPLANRKAMVIRQCKAQCVRHLDHEIRDVRQD